MYLSSEDQEWLNRADSPEKPHRIFIEGSTQEILPSITAIKTGGHFLGSLVLHYDKILLLADSIMTVPVSYSRIYSESWASANIQQSGLYHINRPAGTVSYAFMWSYPNMIPLSASAVYGIWKAIEPFEFETTHGGFPTQDVRATDLKKRVLESMKIWVRTAGHTEAQILEES